MSLNITDYGATSGADVTQIIQSNIDHLACQGGGRIVIPAGVYQTGSLELKSNIELHLEAGAVLNFSDNPTDFPTVDSRWEGVSQMVYRPCIYAHDAENISVTGPGLINGNGQKWWQVFREDKKALAYPRPHFIGFDRCNRVKLADFQAINSPSWTIHPVNCQNVTIDNVSLKNPADSPNTDGIDPESCQNVRISNCQIDVGDDCIAIKAGTEHNREQIACNNIVITNCTLLHGHGGVVIGSEMSGSISNITVSNCNFEQTDRGIRLKSRRGRGGVVKNLIFSNLTMNQVICPFVLNLFYFCGPDGKTDYVSTKEKLAVDQRTPAFQQIHFSNIIASNVQAAAGYLQGLPEMPVRDISFNNIFIQMDAMAVPDKPAMMAGIKPMSKKGFFVDNSVNVLFNHVQIEGFEGPAFTVQNSEKIEMINGSTEGKR